MLFFSFWEEICKYFAKMCKQDDESLDESIHETQEGIVSDVGLDLDQIEEESKEEPVKEEPVDEVVEEPVKEEPVKEEPVKEEPVEEVKEDEVVEEPLKEEEVKEEEIVILEDPTIFSKEGKKKALLIGINYNTDDNEGDDLNGNSVDADGFLIADSQDNPNVGEKYSAEDSVQDEKTDN